MDHLLWFVFGLFGGIILAEVLRYFGERHGRRLANKHMGRPLDS